MTQQEEGPLWLARWRWLMERHIGIIPLPVYLLLWGLAASFVATGKVPSDILANIVLLALGGFTCAELGKHLPGLKHLGAAAIFATFIPSYLVFAHLLPDAVVGSIGEFTKSSNFLYLFISAIIVGSILGMDRHVLIGGFLKIFIPLGLGSVLAALVGVAVGTALGLGAYHSFFFIVVPIMAGGVGEGAIPLSIGYGALLHQPQGEMFAEVLPPVMLGSLTAILAAGTLNFLGKRYPHLTGEGRLQPDGHDLPPLAGGDEEKERRPDIATIGAAVVMAAALYLVGVLAQRLWDWPAPVVMLFLTVILKLGRLVPPELQRGAFAVYRFFAAAVTYPLLFAIGAALTPWEKLTAAINPAALLTIIATVGTLIGTGFVVGRRLGLYPIDTAIVTACHSGQGGTGDVAILTAGNRMALMPFAQIATRIGGALTVTLSLILLGRFS